MNQDNQHQGDILLVGSHLVVDIPMVGNRLVVGTHLEVDNHLEVDTLMVGSHLVVDILVVDSLVEGNAHQQREQDGRRALYHRPGVCHPLLC
ncbi:hypothetical protein ACR8G9_22225 [Salmonella enterica subsp. enterica serovar Paratyphi A]